MNTKTLTRSVVIDYTGKTPRIVFRRWFNKYELHARYAIRIDNKSDRFLSKIDELLREAQRVSVATFNNGACIYAHWWKEVKA